MIAPSQTAAASSKDMPGRLVRERALLPDADVLRVRARSEAEDLVADCELADVRADRLDHSRQLHAEDPLLRSDGVR